MTGRVDVATLMESCIQLREQLAAAEARIEALEAEATRGLGAYMQTVRMAERSGQRADEAEARLAEALAALEFYAAPDSWLPHRTEKSIVQTGSQPMSIWRSVTPVQDDRGERARAVLAAGQPARQGEATP